MTLTRRHLVSATSVLAITVAVLAALAWGPRAYRAYLAVSGVVAIAMAVSSVVADPRELLAALLFAAPPVMSLTVEGSPTWAIGPLAVLLLVGGELNTWSWELGRADLDTAVVRRRAGNVVRLAVAALGASMAITALTQLSLLTATAALLAAAGALLGLGVVVLPSRGGSSTH